MGAKYTVWLKEDKPKPVRNLMQERFEKASKMVVGYESKLRWTEKLLRKWKKKWKYYEKVVSKEA